MGELRRVEEERAAADEGAGADAGLGGEAAGMKLEAEGMVEAGLGDGVAGVEGAAGEGAEVDAGAGAEAGGDDDEEEEEEGESRHADAESEAGATAGGDVVGSRAWGEHWTSSPGRRRLVRASAATCRTGGMLSSCWSVWVRREGCREVQPTSSECIYIYAMEVCGRATAANAVR